MLCTFSESSVGCFGYVQISEHVLCTLSGTKEDFQVLILLFTCAVHIVWIFFWLRLNREMPRSLNTCFARYLVGERISWFFLYMFCAYYLNLPLDYHRDVTRRDNLQGFSEIVLCTLSRRREDIQLFFVHGLYRYCGPFCQLILGGCEERGSHGVPSVDVREGVRISRYFLYRFLEFSTRLSSRNVLFESGLNF